MMKKTILFSAMIVAGTIFAAEPAAPAAAAAAAPAPAAVAAPAPAAAAPAAAAPAAAAPAAAEKEEELGFALCFARGLCNVATGWLELPRCIIWDNGAIPFFGMIVGIPEGAIVTVCRTCSGVFDIVSFGASGSLFHGKRFPNTVFQAKWIYRD